MSTQDADNEKMHRCGGALFTLYQLTRRSPVTLTLGVNVLEAFGAMVLPTGRTVVCDPQFDLVQEPFSVRVDPVEYPVFLSLTDLQEVALLMVQFADGEPDRWIPAEPSFFSVDSGSAGTMDAKVTHMLIRASENERFERHWKRATDKMEENDGLWGNVCLHEELRANRIAFRTMGGDGTYHSYFGCSNDNELKCLVTDFFLKTLVTKDATVS